LFFNMSLSPSHLHALIHSPLSLCLYIFLPSLELPSHFFLYLPFCPSIPSLLSFPRPPILSFPPSSHSYPCYPSLCLLSSPFRLSRKELGAHLSCKNATTTAGKDRVAEGETAGHREEGMSGVCGEATTPFIPPSPPPSPPPPPPPPPLPVLPNGARILPKELINAANTCRGHLID